METLLTDSFFIGFISFPYTILYLIIHYIFIKVFYFHCSPPNLHIEAAQMLRTEIITTGVQHISGTRETFQNL